MTSSLDDADEVVRLLKSELDQEDLRVPERWKLNEVLEWHSGESNQSLGWGSLLYALRAVGDEITLKLDDGMKHYFLQFDKMKGQLTFVELSEDEEIMRPLESLSDDFASIFEESTRKLIPSSEIKQKVNDTLTIVYHEEYGTRIIFGDYPNGVVYSIEDEQVSFEVQEQINLPEPMSQSEILSFLESNYDLDPQQWETGVSRFTEIVNDSD